MYIQYNIFNLIYINLLSTKILLQRTRVNIGVS